ncbi:hypothetical protein D3C76_1476680 [compost metagenome]
MLSGVHPDGVPALHNRSDPGLFRQIPPLRYPFCREQLINPGRPVIEHVTVFIHQVYGSHLFFGMDQIAQEHRHAGVLFPVYVLLLQIGLYISVV